MKVKFKKIENLSEIEMGMVLRMNYKVNPTESLVKVDCIDNDKIHYSDVIDNRKRGFDSFNSLLEDYTVHEVLPNDR